MRVAVIGSGYVGLVAGACFASFGHTVRCLDTNAERVGAIEAGTAPFYEPGLDDLIKKGTSNGLLTASTDIEGGIRDSDVTFIAVGTPDEDGAIDLAQVRGAAQTVGRALAGRSDYHVVVTKSTVTPGTCENVVAKEVFEVSKRPAGDIGICMNPEFLRQGFAVGDFLNPDRVVVGASDERAAEVVMGLYDSVDAPRISTTLANAELIKYASNALLATMISFSNEIANVCEQTPGTDVAVVLNGVHLDRRITVATEHGPVTPGLVSYLMAGGGFGGSCLPKDVKALTAFADERGVAAPLMRAALEINDGRAARVVDMAEDAAGPLAGRTVALVGLAFKAGTDDARDSPAIAIVQVLRARGAHVVAWDPQVRASDPAIPDSVELVEDTAALFADAACCVIATAWPEVADWDWAVLARTMTAPVIVDSRHVIDADRLPDFVVYRTIGRCSA